MRVQIVRNHLLISILCLLITPALRAADSQLGLFFPIAPKSIQILPQSFEYELIDKDRFRIGNILFDARLFEFKVAKGASNDKFKLKLKWPSGLLSSGEISIRDNIGKAIWLHPIDKNSIKFERKIIDKRRMETASLDADILPEDIFRTLQYVPYFQVCVQKNELPTRITLCSKDFFVQVSKGKLEIRSRDSLRHESYVNINANNVDPNGVIFLQGTVNLISMRVLLLSGATLEVDTRKKEVEFRDIASNPNTGRLQVNGLGAHPVAAHKVTDLEDGSWRTELNLERPIIYLRGEGDIPMKQEFILNGRVRDLKTKVEVEGSLPIHTYASEVQIQLKKNPKMSIASADELSTVDDGEENLIWNLQRLSTGTKNRRMLAVSQDGQSFNAGWDITRLKRWDLQAQLGFPVTANLAVRGWLENQHLGAGADYRYDSEWKKGAGSISRVAVPIYYSIPEHRNFIGTAWGPVIAPVNYTFTGGSTQGLSVGAFLQTPMSSDYSFLGAWNATELWAFHLPMGSGIKAENEVRFKTEFLYPYNSGQFFTWGIDFNRLTLKNGEASENISRPGLFFGYRLQF